MPAAQSARPETLAVVRRAVRQLLSGSPGYLASDAETRRKVAEKMVDVSMIAARLIEEERRADAAVKRRQPLARAESAGDQLSMRAVNAAPGALTAARDSIDFPNFVTSLITGVFQAILTSSTAQVGAIGDLVDNVSATSEDFEASIDDSEVARWVVAKLPFLQLDADGISLRPGQDWQSHIGQAQSALRLTADEAAGVDDSDLTGTLLPAAKRHMAQQKQTVLASMIQMGLQRIVVDEGRLHASMDLRVDALSASSEARAQRDDWRVNAGASASFAVGPWGASANFSTSVGQVKSDNQLTNEQIGLRAGLRSSVELAFRTEQVPLDRVADRSQRVRIANNARTPADVSSSSLLAPAPTLTAVPDATPTPPLAPPTAPNPQQNQQTGTPPAQSGTPPAQSGTPPAQSGAPPAQSGTPPAQSGAPPAQSGTPPAQSKAPPAQSGAPPAQSGAPPAQSKAPPQLAPAKK